jgi:hypothetical protein
MREVGGGGGGGVVGNTPVFVTTWYSIPEYIGDISIALRYNNKIYLMWMGKQNSMLKFLVFMAVKIHIV